LDEGRFGPAGIAERWQRTSVAPWAADKFVRRRRRCGVANIAVRKCKRTTNRTNLSGPAEQTKKRARTALAYSGWHTRGEKAGVWGGRRRG
jgi:hypothetical protein